MINIQGAKIVRMVSTNNTTGGQTSSATIDTVGYDYVSIVVDLGAYTTVSQTNNPVVQISHSDTTDATNYSTAIANSNSDGSVARQYILHADRRSALRRYFKVAVTNGTAGTDNAMPVNAIAILTRAEQEPSGTAAMTGSTNDSVTII